MIFKKNRASLLRRGFIETKISHAYHQANLRSVVTKSPIALVVSAIALAGCATSTRDAITVEDKPQEGIIRIRNDSYRVMELQYDHFPQFTVMEIFLVRFRGREGVLIPNNAGGKDGWWSSQYAWSGLGPFPRQKLHIPPRGYVDLPRDFDALVFGMTPSQPIAGPCEIQIRLYVYIGRGRGRVVDEKTDWQPSPCPPSGSNIVSYTITPKQRDSTSIDISPTVLKYSIQKPKIRISL